MGHKSVAFNMPGPGRRRADLPATATKNRVIRSEQLRRKKQLRFQFNLNQCRRNVYRHVHYCGKFVLAPLPEQWPMGRKPDSLGMSGSTQPNSNGLSDSTSENGRFCR